RIAPQIAPPSINLPWNNIPKPSHLANRSARRKCLSDDRSLLLHAPAPPPYRTRQHFNPAHRTVSCTGASHSACTVPAQIGLPARASRPLSDAIVIPGGRLFPNLEYGPSSGHGGSRLYAGADREILSGQLSGHLIEGRGRACSTQTLGTP